MSNVNIEMKSKSPSKTSKPPADLTWYVNYPHWQGLLCFLTVWFARERNQNIWKLFTSFLSMFLNMDSVPWFYQHIQYKRLVVFIHFSDTKVECSRNILYYVIYFSLYFQCHIVIPNNKSNWFTPVTQTDITDGHVRYFISLFANLL